MRQNGRQFLEIAKRNKKDEFYTQMHDIESELSYYQDKFQGKVVYYNCDDPQKSNFFKYFYTNFSKLKLKKLIATSYSKEGKAKLKRRVSFIPLKSCGFSSKTHYQEKNHYSNHTNAINLITRP
ncbi:adenine-specific methyltransferase EcoRI family protein [Mycoplasma sp. Ms02]|uniref:adenine-specific methyltransferase EcoRI family protein n=1 Tax=Mycoplasma sp. Ms02 TaxID=353851 RepID=UPI001C89462B|nr:adenine-specific methyltransferase EcoRI family protein [Mycoplasma sp. Ms02]QZE12449.1 adenine-specific methyltransferase EcoRI family protein [Mycoplasma sp. Ms02]